MALRTVGLPTPGDMKPRWAAYAALLAVRGERWAQGAHATAHGWHYDDGGGNWADLGTRLRAMVAAGDAPTAADLRRILGPAAAHADIDAAVAAAQRF
ncbi:hypothetical protein GR168_00790 [Gordonia sp. JH63]|uniref:hypothetical protein n=1 Tax=Gordonia sp. JH63 TaxID=2698900 RepID=UPI00131F7725|nr:hypothetical protein [Gordonia sp. JH63]QHD84107.1 hypothetical protein GR168_00790 [Gordonia sp. JH63]